MNTALRRVGVIGWPLAHSLSPLIHQFWMKKAGLPENVYELLPTAPDALFSRLENLAADGFVGCNVTVPHKEAVFSFLNEHGTLDANAARLQAVNTILIDKNGGLCGRNSDGSGFLAGMDEQAPRWRDTRGAAVIFGAGGAARAIIAALADGGVKPIFIVNRTRAHAEALLRDLQITEARIFGTSAAELRHAIGNACLLVNATSLGMAGACSWREGIGSAAAAFLSHVHTDAIAADIVYAPLQTEFLQAARARALTCVDGLGMLLHQAVPCFEAWFGVRPRVVPALRAILERALHDSGARR